MAMVAGSNGLVDYNLIPSLILITQKQHHIEPVQGAPQSLTSDLLVQRRKEVRNRLWIWAFVVGMKSQNSAFLIYIYIYIYIYYFVKCKPKMQKECLQTE